METNTIERSPTFIPLTNKLFAEYLFTYRINDPHSINDFSKIKNKHQLLFQKIENKNQQLNLMFVDSQFANILADLTVEVLLKKVSSFQDYILSSDKIKLFDESNEKIYFSYKFSDFIYLLLYGDISSTRLFNQEIFTDRVFYLKNNFGKLDYFSIHEQKILQSKLLNEMKIEIDYSLSNISNQEAKIYLKFFI